MFLMRADPLRGQVGEGWALEIESFLGPGKRHRADRRVPFGDVIGFLTSPPVRLSNITALGWLSDITALPNPP
jgi:hypothetical protein